MYRTYEYSYFAGAVLAALGFLHGCTSYTYNPDYCSAINVEGDDACRKKYGNDDGARSYCILGTSSCIGDRPEEYAQAKDFDGCVETIPDPLCHSPCGFEESAQERSCEHDLDTDQDPTLGSDAEGTTASTGRESTGSTGGGSTGAESTDSGSTDSGSTDSGSTDSGSTGAESTGEMPECVTLLDCGSNQDCVAGNCVPMCKAWSPGGYGSCLTPYGHVDPDTLCEQPSTCAVFSAPIEATACARQECSSACDCPVPPPTGTATVTCGEITAGGETDCYLSCASGETCPDGMECFNNTFCMTPVAVELPMYGNCGNIAAPCADSQCIIENGYSICMSLCENTDGEPNLMLCDPPPPGADAVACDGMIYPPDGLDCHLPCNADDDCPLGMECYQSNLEGPPPHRLCMWPPL